MNFSFLSKVNQLEQRVGNISDSQHDLVQQMDNQASQVNAELQEFIDKQSWMSRVTMQIDNNETKNGEAKATFQWQVKELQNNSEVMFHYSFGKSEKYTAIPAVKLEEGLFQAKIPFTFDKEPQWRIGLITPDSYHSEEASEKEALDGDQDMISFYVTVSYDDSVKSSELQNEYLKDYRSSYYGIIQTDVHVFRSKLDITLINYQIDEKSVSVQRAILLKYKGNTLIGEEELEMVKESPQEYGERFFNLNQVEKYDDIKLVLKVVYNNGDNFEKEIY
ncbi:hypothetical protein [Bacillus timonensis]|uniref:hypothetical protein n=1 Tax=Bacillus timonensis TaxID=1033734 RepID=UPI0002897184|nr:hypothetical protein [Bacillus timonensis]